MINPKDKIKRVGGHRMRSKPLWMTGVFKDIINKIKQRKAQKTHGEKMRELWQDI